jgi:hypothetical protein
VPDVPAAEPAAKRAKQAQQPLLSFGEQDE